jgi:hypothetical protein
MICKTENRSQEDIAKKQMVDIAWKLVTILDTLTLRLWSIFEDEFIDRINNNKQKEMPF